MTGRAEMGYLAWSHGGTDRRLECFSQLLEETEHFRRWPQIPVAKIVHSGETLVEKTRTSLVSTEYSGIGRSKELLMWSAFCFAFSDGV